MGAIPRAATLYSAGSAGDPDHGAVIRFGSRAPRRRPHSQDGAKPWLISSTGGSGLSFFCGWRSSPETIAAAAIKVVSCSRPTRERLRSSIWVVMGHLHRFMQRRWCRSLAAVATRRPASCPAVPSRASAPSRLTRSTALKKQRARAPLRTALAAIEMTRDLGNVRASSTDVEPHSLDAASAEDEDLVVGTHLPAGLHSNA